MEFEVFRLVIRSRYQLIIYWIQRSVRKFSLCVGQELCKCSGFSVFKSYNFPWKVECLNAFKTW